MKKLFVILAVLMLSSMALAQAGPIDKGSMLISGGLSFTSAGGDLYKDFEDNSETQFTINPSVSYFFMKGLALGPTVEFGSMKQGDFKQSLFGFGAQVAYYFDALAKGKEGKGVIYPYLGADFLFESQSMNTGDPGEEDTKYSGTRIAFKGGAVYMVSTAVGAFGQFEYDLDSMKQTDPVESDSQSGNIMQISIGLTYFIF